VRETLNVVLERRARTSCAKPCTLREKVVRKKMNVVRERRARKPERR
jgi:hypothetical protein